MEQIKCRHCGAWTDASKIRCNHCNTMLRRRAVWFRSSKTLLGFSLLLWAVIILLLAIVIFVTLFGSDFFG